MHANYGVGIHVKNFTAMQSNALGSMTDIEFYKNKEL